MPENTDPSRVSIRFNEAEREALQTAAEAANCSMATLIRFALAQQWGSQPNAGRLARAYLEEVQANVAKVGK